MFVSLQAEQNFLPAGQISLQCGIVSLMYFLILSLHITKFPGKELPVLPVFFFQACFTIPFFLFEYF